MPRATRSRAIGRRDYTLAWCAIGVAIAASLADRWCGTAHAQHADIFSAIWAAIEAVGSILGTAGEVIADALVAAVSWLTGVVGWLATQLATLFVNVGSMFAKIWEGIKIVWEDALKPALVWIDDQMKRLYAWLHDTFQPVFDFLKRVRDVVKGIYETWVKPVLEALDIAHGVLKTLGDLGLQWARALDRYVVETRDVITENWLRITGWINELYDIVNSVVTPGRLFQRLPFLSTFNRDLLYCQRLMSYARMKPLTDEQAARRAAAAKPQVTTQLVADLSGYLGGATNDSGDVIDAAVNAAVDLLNAA